MKKKIQISWVVLYTASWRAVCVRGRVYNIFVCFFRCLGSKGERGGEKYYFKIIGIYTISSSRASVTVHSGHVVYVIICTEIFHFFLVCFFFLFFSGFLFFKTLASMC